MAKKKSEETPQEEQPRAANVDQQIQAMLGAGVTEEDTDAEEAEEDRGAETEQTAETEEELEVDGDESEEELEDEDDDEDEEELDDEEEDEDDDGDGDEAGATDDEDGEDDDDDEEEDPTEALRAENEALKKALDRQASGPEVPLEEETEELAPLELQPIEFVDEEAYDKALESREALNELLNKVVAHTAEVTREAVLKRVPQVVQRQVSHETANQQMVSDFFRANEDLLPVRRYVALEFQQVLAANPDMSYPDALTMTANTVRTSLGMAKAKGKKAKKSRRRRAPSLPDGPRSRTRPRKPSGVASEIAAMMGAGRR